MENVEVVTRWVLATLTIQAGAHALLSPTLAGQPENLGTRIHAAACRFQWAAQQGDRQREMELLLLQADLDLTPATKSRNGKPLKLAMPAWQWEGIEQLAAFYGTTAASVCHALLVPLVRQNLRQQQRGAIHGTAGR